MDKYLKEENGGKLWFKNPTHSKAAIYMSG